MWPWNRKSKPEESPKPQSEERPKETLEDLKPGVCECEHERCCHENGKGRCHAGYPPDNEWKHGSQCACQFFIRDDDDGESEPETPTPGELEKLYGR